MSSIRIVSTPPGQAPKWVRKEWVGLIIPLLTKPTHGVQVGVLGGKPENLDGYEVSTTDAIRQLKKKSIQAAAWFEKNLPLANIPSLVFSKDVCKEVP